MTKYLAICQTKSYDLLTYIMQNVVFNKHAIRKPFFEEVSQGSFVYRLSRTFLALQVKEKCKAMKKNNDVDVSRHRR